jgi:peptidyl-prolyl cis-trans isomerase SurA
MKIKKFYFFLLLFIINYNQIIYANTQNKIIVKIEDEIITSYDIKNKILTTLVLANRQVDQKSINNLKEQALESLIQNKLKKIELKQFNFKKDALRINSYLNSISLNNIQALKEKFILNKIDYEVFISELDYEFQWRNLIFNKYSNKIEIDQRNIDEEIKNIVKNQNDLIEFNLSEIEILSNNNETDQIRVNQIKNEIKNFGFESAVLKYSISPTSSNKGKIGWVNSNALSKQILKEINTIEIGDISDPIKQQNSLLFLKLNNKKISKSSEVNIDKLKADLINKKKNELFNLFSRSYLSKLRNTKLIEYFVNE